MKRPISSPSTKTTEPSAPVRSGGPWPPADRALAVHGSWDWLAFPRQPRVLPAVLRAVRPSLVVGLMALLVGGSGLLALWGTHPSSRADESGIRLRREVSSPNLNDTSAEAPCVPAPAPQPEPVAPAAAGPSYPEVKPAEPALSEAPPTPPSAEAPRTLEIVPDGTPVPAVVEVPEPADVIDIRVSHRGDTPMIREWKLLGLQTILAGALVALPAQAEPIDGPPNDKKKEESSDVKKDKDDLVEQLREFRRAFDALNAKLAKDIPAISNDALEAKNKAAQAKKELDELKEQVARLQKEVDALRSGSGRIAAYPPNGGTGRLRLLNTFTTPVTIIVNGKVYHVDPGETRFTDALPAGTVNYEVLGIQTARNTRLDANETLTINVFTR